MALLIYSTSWCQSSCDSVIVSVDALRIANAKMLELKYEKEINANLQEVVRVDSVLISSLESNLFAVKEQAKEELDDMRKQRNKAIVVGGTSSLILLILLIAAL